MLSVTVSFSLFEMSFGFFPSSHLLCLIIVLEEIETFVPYLHSFFVPLALEGHAQSRVGDE